MVSLSPSPSLWIPFLQLPVHLLNSQALLICGRLESTPKWDVWPSGKISETLALNLGPWLYPLTTQMGPGQEPRPSGRQFQTFPASKVGRGQGSVLRVHPGTRKESLGIERGPAAGPAPSGPLIFSPSGPVAPPSRARLCQAIGRGRTSSLGRGRVLEDRDRCRLAWVSRGYIYILKKAAGNPGAGRSLRAQHCRGPGQERSAFLSRGWLSIYSLRQAGQGAEEGGLARVEGEEAGSPSHPPPATKRALGEVCTCPKSHSPPVRSALNWMKRRCGWPLHRTLSTLPLSSPRAIPGEEP